jgi:hypothetical protein
MRAVSDVLRSTLHLLYQPIFALDWPESLSYFQSTRDVIAFREIDYRRCVN